GDLRAQEHDGRASLLAGPRELLPEILGRGGADGDAEAGNDRGQIGAGQVDRGRLAEGVALGLAQDAVATVVDYEQLGAQLVLCRRAELGQRVLEPAVADHGEDVAVGVGDARAEGSGPRVPERPRAKRVEELLTGAHGEVRGRPVAKD